MTKRLTPEEKKERRPASRACTFCHSKHLQCSSSRPCQNCTKRGIAHECRDVTRKRVKYLSPSSADNDASASPKKETGYMDGYPAKNTGYRLKDTAAGARYTPSLSPYGRPEPSRDSPAPLPPAASFNQNLSTQEYRILGDLLSRPSSPASIEFVHPQPQHSVMAGLSGGRAPEGSDGRPFIALGNGGPPESAKNGFNFDLSSDNDHRYVSPLASHHIYQTVQDIYSNKFMNFDYPSSYHSLTHFLKLRFSVINKQVGPEEKSRKTGNLLKILKLIASYRPTFISAHKSLFQPFDFQFLEMSFQRCLLDYENLCRLNASPTIIWRRTGEIVSMSKDLVELLGLNVSDILSKRTFIMELMHDDESIVEYFRLFKSVAVGNLHSRIETKCKLIKKPSGDSVSTNAKLDTDFIEFCSVWTVKRDLFDLPMMVVGQFLPVL